jgi:hypothetical protein
MKLTGLANKPPTARSDRERALGKMVRDRREVARGGHSREPASAIRLSSATFRPLVSHAGSTFDSSRRDSSPAYIVICHMTLFDPTTWELPADLIDHWKTITAVATLSAIGTLAKWGTVQWIWSMVRRARVKPERPLRFVSDERQSCWGRCRLGDQRGTSVFGQWHVTNISDRNILLLKARLPNYEARFSNVFIEAPVDKNGVRHPSFALYPIPAHQMSEVVADFTFVPSIRDGREPLVSDVIFTDNFEEEHLVRSVRFRAE